MAAREMDPANWPIITEGDVQNFAIAAEDEVRTVSLDHGQTWYMVVFTKGQPYRILVPEDLLPKLVHFPTPSTKYMVGYIKIYRDETD